MGIFSRGKAPLTVSYRAKADPGGIDQTVSLVNRTETAIVPTLEFTARDHYGRDLPNVEIRTVLGIDRGTVLIPPGLTGEDVLIFAGEGCRYVRHVDVRVVEMYESECPEIAMEVESLMINLEQQRVLDPTDFWGIGLANRNAVALETRVALVAWEAETPKDDPRQVADAMYLQDLATVGPESSEVIWLPEDIRGQFHGVLNHFVPPDYV